jgi:methylthioribose-1-phosphate isomerase
MRIGGQDYRSIWIDETTGNLEIIDQTVLPHLFTVRVVGDVEAAAEAIYRMRVRGAPLIGATAAHGLALALAEDPSDEALDRAAQMLLGTRPTAVNLAWAIDRVKAVIKDCPLEARGARALSEAIQICDENALECEAIGDHGLALLQKIVDRRRDTGRAVSSASPLQILTHCNAGWLATVDWGTALAPIYKACQAGLPIHVWVDETRPRNQGASLTAFELREMGVPHTVIVDNAGGHLMQRGRVDAVIVGSDRTTSAGDVCNKIGTYLKALAAWDNDVPFFVALPLSTVDWEISDGLTEIEIEERDESEVRQIAGLTAGGAIETVKLFSEESPAANPAFDTTPARYVTSLITERGVCAASREGLSDLRAKA